MKVSSLIVSALASLTLASPVIERDTGSINYNISSPNSASSHIPGPDIADLAGVLGDVLQGVASIDAMVIQITAGTVATLAPTLTTELNQLDVVVDHLNAAVGLVTAEVTTQGGIVGPALSGILNGRLQTVIRPAVESLLVAVGTLTGEGGVLVGSLATTLREVTADLTAGLNLALSIGGMTPTQLSL